MYCFDSYVCKKDLFKYEESFWQTHSKLTSFSIFTAITGLVIEPLFNWDKDILNEIFVSYSWLSYI